MIIWEHLIRRDMPIMYVMHITLMKSSSKEISIDIFVINSKEI